MLDKHLQGTTNLKGQFVSFAVFVDCNIDNLDIVKNHTIYNIENIGI